MFDAERRRQVAEALDARREAIVDAIVEAELRRRELLRRDRINKERAERMHAFLRRKGVEPPSPGTKEEPHSLSPRGYLAARTSRERAAPNAPSRKLHFADPPTYIS